MRHEAKQYFYAANLLICLLLVCGCEQIPTEPEGTFDRANGGKVRVGISTNPPFTTFEDKQAGGIEVELLLPFFENHQSEIEWIHGGESELFERLKEFEIDLVLGGITDDNPWSKELGFTRAYLEREERGKKLRHVLVAPPGENRWILELDKFLAAQKEKARQLYSQAEPK